MSEITTAEAIVTASKALVRCMLYCTDVICTTIRQTAQIQTSIHLEATRPMEEFNWRTAFHMEFERADKPLAESTIFFSEDIVSRPSASWRRINLIPPGSIG